MPDLSRLRLIRGQGGSTLIELLVAMPIAIMLLGLITQAFVTGSEDQRRLERRTAALNTAQHGLERMTRELRQANWVYFTSSQIVDADVMVRPDPSLRAVQRHVRYDCSNSNACWRYEGPAVPFPPTTVAAFDRSTMVLGSPPEDPDSYTGRIFGQDIFLPSRIDPQTGLSSANYVDPDMLYIRLRIAVKGLDKPIELADGVSLRNRTRFGS